MIIWRKSCAFIVKSNFYTTYDLAIQLLACFITLDGTVRKKKPFFPKINGHEKSSLLHSEFLFTRDIRIVSYTGLHIRRTHVFF